MSSYKSWMFCVTAAVSAAACGSTADVSGAYTIAIDDGTPVQGQLYLLRSAGEDYMGVLNDGFCSVEHDSDALTLHQCTLSAPGQPNQFESNGPIYVDFKLSREADGLANSIDALDRDLRTSVRGTLKHSERRPGLRGDNTEASGSSARPTLPWDTLSLDFGEGVLIDESTLSDALSVAADSGAQVEAHWSYLSIAVPGTRRKLGFQASANLNWWELAGDTVTFSLPQGTPDSAGRKTRSNMSVSYELLQPAAPARTWEFDDDAALEGLFTWRLCARLPLAAARVCSSARGSRPATSRASPVSSTRATLQRLSCAHALYSTSR